MTGRLSLGLVIHMSAGSLCLGLVIHMSAGNWSSGCCIYLLASCLPLVHVIIYKDVCYVS